MVCRFLLQYNKFTKGDVSNIDNALFCELEKKGIVEKFKGEQKIEEKKKIETCNIKGEKYITGKIDFVIPTKNKENVKPKFNKEARINSIEIIESDFEKTKKGFAETCNKGAGIYQKRGEFILFLNDDVEIRNNEEFLNQIVEPFKDSKVGITGNTYSMKEWGVNGAIMCIRRELFERIGGFDENYFFMWEDNDICENIKNRGYKIAISNANAVHKGNSSIIQYAEDKEKWKKYHTNGRKLFEKKWKDKKRIIGSCIVGNENGRYLIECVSDYIDRKLVDFVDIVCDNSNKETMQEIEELQKKYKNIKVHYHDFQLFGYAENKLRERAIDYALSQNPYAIIPFDADEKWEENITRKDIYKLLKNGDCFDFMIAHFWDSKENIRTDGTWGRQKNVRLFKVIPNVEQKFYEKNLHCGSAPIYAYQKRQLVPYIFYHYGHLRAEDRAKKVERQQKFDPKMLLEAPNIYIGDKEQNVKTEKYNRATIIKNFD